MRRILSQQQSQSSNNEQDSDDSKWEMELGNVQRLIAHDIEAARNSAIHLLGALHHKWESLIEPIRIQLQNLLTAVEGLNFKDHHQNAEFARTLQSLLDKLESRVACPKYRCSRAATLRASLAGNSKSGVFQFDHQVNGRRSTHMGSHSVPRLRLVEKPEDKRRLPKINRHK